MVQMLCKERDGRAKMGGHPCPSLHAGCRGPYLDTDSSSISPSPPGQSGMAMIPRSPQRLATCMADRYNDWPEVSAALAATDTLSMPESVRQV